MVRLQKREIFLHDSTFQPQLQASDFSLYSLPVCSLQQGIRNGQIHREASRTHALFRMYPTKMQLWKVEISPCIYLLYVRYTPPVRGRESEFCSSTRCRNRRFLLLHVPGSETPVVKCLPPMPGFQAWVPRDDVRCIESATGIATSCKCIVRSSLCLH